MKTSKTLMVSSHNGLNQQFTVKKENGDVLYTSRSGKFVKFNGDSPRIGTIRRSLIDSFVNS